MAYCWQVIKLSLLLFGVMDCQAQLITVPGTGPGTSTGVGDSDFKGCYFFGDIKGEVGSRSVSVIEGVYTVADCQKECQKHPGCGYFSFNSFNATCKLRWAEITTITDQDDITFISGPRNCVGCFVTGEGYAADGCIDTILEIGCAMECQLRCALHTECVSFTHYPSESKCQLNAKSARRVVNPKAVSGPKRCPTCDCTVDN